MSIFRIVLSVGIVASGLLGGTKVATAQKEPSAVTPVPDTAELPKRRPEEAQADPMQAFDINKDGKLSLAEVKSAAAARYDELNPDQDDKLDAKEAGSTLQGEAFRQADTDGDGTIDKAEYLAYVEQAFNRANPDKDGSLDRAELQTEAGRALLSLLR